MAGEKLVQKALQAAMEARAARYVADPAKRAENLAKWQAQTPKEITEPRWYHGTQRDYDVMKPGEYPRASFVTTDPNFASPFSMPGGKIDGKAMDYLEAKIQQSRSYGQPIPQPNVMPLHVRAENPFDYENPDHVAAVVNAVRERASKDPSLNPGHAETIARWLHQGDWNLIEGRPVQQALKELGHDAFYVNERGFKNLGVFEPERQLKSATGNLGTFDINSPRLDENRGGEVREHHADGERVGTFDIRAVDPAFGENSLTPREGSSLPRAVQLARNIIDAQSLLPAQGAPVDMSLSPQFAGMAHAMGKTPIGAVSVPVMGGNLHLQGGYDPLTKFEHYGARYTKNFAEGGPVDYQSNSEPVVKDGVINWGDPDNKADFFRAAAAMQRATELAKEVERPVAERAPAPTPVVERREPAPAPAPAAQAIETAAPPAPAPVAQTPPQALPYAPVPTTEEVAKLTNRVAPGPDLTDRQRDLIVRTIAAETSGKTPEETRAIAHVILNRIMSGKFGATPEQVLFAKNQFEPWSNPAGPNYPMRISPQSQRYVSSAQALDAALGGEDITGGASNFWGPVSQAALGRQPPDWALKTPGVDIGATRFHKVTDVTPRATAPTLAQPPAQPSVGLFAFGTNDAKPETALKSAQQIYENAQRAGIQPVFVLPNSSDPKFAPISEALRKFAEEKGIQFEAPGYDPRDPLHITPQTAQEIAKKYPGAFVAGDSNSWRLQRYGYGRPVADQKSFIDPRSGVTLGRVGAGSSEIAKAFKEYVDSLSKGRSEGGEVEREHHADGNIVGKALEAIRGYHGSGRKFKQFDTSKMGSGAGQMYGRGVYITESPEVARDYRSMGLKGSPNIMVGREALPSFYEHLQAQADKMPMEQARPLYDRLSLVNDLMDRGDALAIRTAAENQSYTPEVLQWFEKHIAPRLKTPGGLYEVQINAKPEQFIHWQRPFSEQSAFIQDVTRPMAVELAEKANAARSEMLKRGEDFMGRPYSAERMESLRQIMTPEQVGGFRLYGKPHEDLGMTSPGGWSQKANEQLRELGIVGNTYGDKANNRPVQNYVVFDPKDTEILTRYNTGGEVLSDKYPTHYLPNVGRQVMQDGGVPPEVSMTRARKLALEELGKFEDKPPMDPAVMGQNWANAVQRFRENPIREGEVVARSYQPGPRDVIGGAIAGDDRMSHAGELRRRAADLLVGSTGLPGSGTAGFGLVDAPLIPGLVMQAGDVGQSVKEGDYTGAALGTLMPAAFWARKPIMDAGRRAMEIAREYTPQIATAAGAGATLAPSDAEAGTLAQFRKVFNPTLGYGRTPDEQSRLVEHLKRVASPAHYDPEVAKQGLELARRLYSTKIGAEFKEPNSYFNIKPPMSAAQVRATVDPMSGVSPKTENPIDWENFMRSNKGAAIINIGGDRTNLGVLKDINGQQLAWDVPLYAGPKYMLEPNPGLVWANAAGHSTAYKNAIAKASNSGKRDVFGVYAPMTPQAGDSAHHMFDAVMAQIPNAKISRKDAKAFDDAIKAGLHLDPSDRTPKALEAVAKWPGILNAREASDFARNLDGGDRSGIIKMMDKRDWASRGFPDIGATRVAITDPAVMNAPTNTLGHRIVQLDPDAVLSGSRPMMHTTYTGDTGGKYIGDLPLLQSQYVMPDVMEKIVLSPTKKGQIIHPYSLDPKGRDSARKFITEQKLIQDINDKMIDSVLVGLQRQKLYGFKKGGSVEKKATDVVSKRGSK